MAIKTIVLTNGQEIVGEIINEEENYLTIKNTIHFLMGQFGEEQDSLRPFPWPTHSDPVPEKILRREAILHIEELRDDARKVYDQFMMSLVYNPG